MRTGLILDMVQKSTYIIKLHCLNLIFKQNLYTKVLNVYQIIHKLVMDFTTQKKKFVTFLLFIDDIKHASQTCKKGWDICVCILYS